MDARSILPDRFTWREVGKAEAASQPLKGRGNPVAVTLTLPTTWDPTPPVDCPCSRLVAPLGDGEELPDHVCEPTRRETVFDWTSRRLEMLVPALKQGFPVSYQLGEKYMATLAPVPETEPPEQWPLPVDDGYVGLVIQQWVEEAPNQTLANQLARDRVWQGRLKRFREYVLEPMLRDGGWDGDDLSKTTMVITNRPIWARGWIAGVLRGVRLPHSPATVEHFFAALAHQQEPLPAHGLLVTTVVYMQPKRREQGEEQAEFVVDPIPRVEISGDLEFATQDLFMRAQQTAHKHRDWVRERLRGGRGHRLSDIRDKRRAQPGAFQSRLGGDPDDIGYDYETVAEFEIDDLVERCRKRKLLHPVDRETVITEYLDDIYRRARKRRLNAGLRTTPPPNWRKEMRAYLRTLLDQRLA